MSNEFLDELPPWISSALQKTVKLITDPIEQVRTGPAAQLRFEGGPGGPRPTAEGLTNALRTLSGRYENRTPEDLADELGMGFAGAVIGENALLAPAERAVVRSVKSGKAPSGTGGWFVSPLTGRVERDVATPRIKLTEFVDNGPHNDPVFKKYYGHRYPDVTTEIDPRRNTAGALTSTNLTTGELIPKSTHFRDPEVPGNTKIHEDQHLLTSASQPDFPVEADKGYSFDKQTKQHVFHNIINYLKNWEEIRSQVQEQRINWPQALRDRIPIHEHEMWQRDRISRNREGYSPTEEAAFDLQHPTRHEFQDFLGQYGIPESTIDQIAKSGRDFGVVYENRAKPEPKPAAPSQAELDALPTLETPLFEFQELDGPPPMRIP